MSLSDARLDICRQCEHFNNIVKTCGICYCFMPAKVLLAHASCPANPPRWLAVQGPILNNDNCCNKESK